MNIVFAGASHSSMKLCTFLISKDITVDGIYDISLQKAVEFASDTDTKAFYVPDEAFINADLIFVAHNTDIKSYIRLFTSLGITNKMLCLISDSDTSELLYTNETNTHFSIYSPYIFSKDNSVLFDRLIFEGYGTARCNLELFFSDHGIMCNEITIDNMKAIHAAVSLIKDGIMTIRNIANDIVRCALNDKNAICDEVIKSTMDTCEAPIYSNDTYHIIKTIDTLYSLDKSSAASLYKIIGLNATEYTSFNKDDTDHLRNTLLNTKNK